jgi:signal transduction histidine kinase/CheY-like chemotaxis protein
MRDPRFFAIGEGLVGQAAADRRRRLITDLDTHAIEVRGGLVAAAPRSVIVLPVLYEGEVKAVVELASLYDFTPSQLAFLEQLTDSIGVVLNTIEATMRTEELLKQSQQLAGELQTQQRELQQTNEELATKARLLAEQNVEVERKNTEIELARKALEEKAAELALTSRYKSEFLANMSHELRTPLNSILILGQQLSQNSEGNLSGRQVEYARTIHSAGTDLLNLITDILDLSKIESGTVTVEYEELSFGTLRETIERSFRHEAETRKLAFTLEFDERLARSMTTDSKRLLQILKNLLSNAFKFTERGGVRLHVAAATGGWSIDHPSLSQSGTIIEFSVSDTGIGIPDGDVSRIFDEFVQIENPMQRRVKGTGLGLPLSKRLAELLGGTISVSTTPGLGSTFCVTIPLMPADLDAETLAPDPSRRPVLVIDDDDADLLVYERAFANSPFQLVPARSAAAAIRVIDAMRPVAIVLDIRLHGGEAWDFLARLKQQPATSRLPVIVVSSIDDEPKAQALGADA